MKLSDIYGGGTTGAAPAPSSSTQTETQPTRSQLDQSKANATVQGKPVNAYGTIALLAFVGVLVGLKFGLENNNSK